LYEITKKTASANSWQTLKFATSAFVVTIAEKGTKPLNEEDPHHLVSLAFGEDQPAWGLSKVSAGCGNICL
jgi:hypothetical protein